MRSNVKMSGRRRRSARLTCYVLRPMPTPARPERRGATCRRNAGERRRAWLTVFQDASSANPSSEEEHRPSRPRPTGACGATNACANDLTPKPAQSQATARKTKQFMGHAT